MGQYTINSDYGSYFGMDVHARSVTIKGYECATGATKTKRFGNCPQASELASWMDAHFTRPFYAAYESGCTGFHLARELSSLGVDCDVVAVSSIARSSEDKLHKTDARDAARLLAELINPASTYSVVWCPDVECEALRNLVRARQSAVCEVKRAKQHVSALLMTHGIVWNKRTESGRVKSTWTREYRVWLNAVSLGESAAQAALDFYIRSVDENSSRAEELSGRCLDASASKRWKPFVDALSAIKGIDAQEALLLAAEIGDFFRFARGSTLPKWAGLTPSESTSDGRTSHGSITKAGDGFVRAALIEGLNALCHQTSAPKALKRGQAVSCEVLKVCHDATRRVQKRYEHFVGCGIGPNKAKVACAAELLKWVWAVGRMVQREQEGVR